MKVQSIKTDTEALLKTLRKIDKRLSEIIEELKQLDQEKEWPKIMKLLKEDQVLKSQRNKIGRFLLGDKAPEEKQYKPSADPDNDLFSNKVEFDPDIPF